MKLPASLLQAITLGVLIPCLASCSYNDQTGNGNTPAGVQADTVIPRKTAIADSSEAQPVDSLVEKGFNCPACGRG